MLLHLIKESKNVFLSVIIILLTSDFLPAINGKFFASHLPDFIKKRFNGGFVAIDSYN